MLRANLKKEAAARCFSETKKAFGAPQASHDT